MKIQDIALIVLVFGLVTSSIINAAQINQIEASIKTVREQLEESRVPIMEPVSMNYIYDNHVEINIENSTGVEIGENNLKPQTETVSSPEVIPMKNDILSEADARLIALIVLGEAEGESERGQRLVADTILNRMDSIEFPDTAYDVTHQPGQYSCVWNGRLKRCKVTDDICQLVQEEAANRTDREVIFFRTGHYGYGKPMFQEGSHYFCGLNI